jgi:hypothetical protein
MIFGLSYNMLLGQGGMLVRPRVFRLGAFSPSTR